MADVAKTIGRLICSILWLALLIIVAWPLAYFCAAWWVFFLPLEPLADISKFIILCTFIFRELSRSFVIFFFSSHFTS